MSVLGTLCVHAYTVHNLCAAHLPIAMTIVILSLVSVSTSENLHTLSLHLSFEPFALVAVF